MSTTTQTPNSGPRTAKLALLVPLAILAIMVGFVGLIATLLLFNTKTGSLALAAVAAAGILMMVSLLASRDGLNNQQKFAAVGAAVVPLALGGLIAGGVIGGIEDEDRMINVQPLLQIPDDAPLIGSTNSMAFCDLDDPDDAECEDSDTWEVVPSEDEENLSFFYDNREAGVQHNVVITTLDDPDDPAPGEELANSDVIVGPATDYFVSEDLTWGDVPDGRFYYFCAVHPTTMTGVGSVELEE